MQPPDQRVHLVILLGLAFLIQILDRFQRVVDRFVYLILHRRKLGKIGIYDVEQFLFLFLLSQDKCLIIIFTCLGYFAIILIDLSDIIEKVCPITTLDGIVVDAQASIVIILAQ